MPQSANRNEEDDMRRTTTCLSAVCLLLLAACGDADEASVDAVGDSAAVQPAPVAPADAASVTPEGMIDPNEASRDELIAATGISDVAADALIVGRPYSTMLEVDAVLAEHLTDQERAAVYETLWSPIDLNTATEEEILLIPNVDPRMPHEFDEYRPYDDIEKFRREIGKYVDAAEVARLERYVEIR
ncbi:MAG: hypothetical protein WEF86_17245 [Gemmatimonadota bacterium]